MSVYYLLETDCFCKIAFNSIILTITADIR